MTSFPSFPREREEEGDSVFRKTVEDEEIPGSKLLLTLLTRINEPKHEEGMEG